MKSPLLRFFAAFVGVLLVSFVTLLPLCNLLFTCGCTATETAHCNVHHATGPRCPWCAHGNGVFATAYGLTLIGVAGSIIGSLESRCTGGRTAVAFCAGLAGYFVSAGLVGLGSALYFHYPTWFGLHV